MSAKFAFYIHHHGSGHLMRALAIASQLKDSQVTFLGSGLTRFRDIIPENIHCINLPDDVAGPQDIFASRKQLDFLHYVPMNVEKVAARAAAISSALHALFPSILVVDVSVEVTLLATLCGTPTVVIRQNGDRDDQAHLLAYECAQLLVAPSAEALTTPSSHDWVNEKSFFSGGFSKYSDDEKYKKEADDHAIGVIVGSGGTSLDGTIVNNLAMQCPERSILVIGDITEKFHASAPNVVLYGQINNPADVLSQCDIVVGNAGHNTVMEMADLGKKFICIPEDRPFQEQLLKADLLKKNGMAVVVQANELKNADWKTIVKKADNLRDDCWRGVISDSALQDIAQQLYKIWQSNFTQKLS